MNMKLNDFKYETVSSIGMKLSDLNKKPSSFYDQPSDYPIKWPLLKSPEKYSHASQFTKNIYIT